MSLSLDTKNKEGRREIELLEAHTQNPREKCLRKDCNPLNMMKKCELCTQKGRAFGENIVHLHSWRHSKKHRMT